MKWKRKRKKMKNRKQISHQLWLCIYKTKIKRSICNKLTLLCLAFLIFFLLCLCMCDYNILIFFIFVLFCFFFASHLMNIINLAIPLHRSSPHHHHHHHFHRVILVQIIHLFSDKINVTIMNGEKWKKKLIAST